MEFENLLKLINTVSVSTLTEFHYEERDVKISFQKNASGQIAAANVPLAVIENVPVQSTNSLPEVSENLAKEQEGNVVKSPLVGTFYAAPAEDAEPFVKVGDRVEKGQILAIIEAMKLMNEIEGEFSGEIVEIYVENGAAVEYGQPLFRIR